MYLWQIGIDLDKTYYYIVASTARQAMDKLIALDRGSARHFEESDICSCKWLALRSALIL